MKNKISIAIPTYEYGGYGKECLEYSFEKIHKQSFRDFNVIISDSSKDDEIESLCDIWKDIFEIKYVKSLDSIGNPAKNMNNVVLHSDGEWIKILCQDDYLLDENSLQILNNSIDSGDTFSWIATGYLHTNNRESYFNYHAPYLNPRIYVINTIGTPSCVTIKNEKPLPMIEFDERLSYAYDCEFYYRYYLEHGNPRLLSQATIANYLWSESISAGITNEFIQRENNYILRKHGFLKDD